MAEIKISCSSCGQHITCDDSYGGQQIACPQCQTAFVVPQVVQAKPTLHVATPREKAYLVNSNGKQQGPYTVEALKPMLESGQLAWEDLAWCEGMSNWQPLRGIIVPAGLSTTPPPLPSARRATGQNQSVSAKRKHRAKWWIVSTHVVTTVIAAPVAFWLLVGLVIQVMGIQIPNSLATIIGVSVLALLLTIGATAYSLAYLRDHVLTDDWRGCIAPALISASLLTLIEIAVTAIFAAQSVAAPAINLLLQLAAFSILTVNGFRDLQKY